MKKVQKKPKHELKGVPGWMASYADMVTVLMAFFILLFAMSVVDQERFEAFLVSWSPARADEFMPADGMGGGVLHDLGDGILPDQPPPPPPGYEGEEDDDAPGTASEGVTVDDIMNTFRTYMAETLHADGFDFDVEAGENYVRILIDGQDYMLFNTGEARLAPGAAAVLDALGPILLEFSEAGHYIIVEGHTDNIPINTAAFPSNWTLSGARASTVVEHLTDNWGLHPRNIVGVGRGEYFPIDDNATAEGRARNRRVEILVFTLDATGGPVGAPWRIPMD